MLSALTILAGLCILAVLIYDNYLMVSLPLLIGSPLVFLGQCAYWLKAGEWKALPVYSALPSQLASYLTKVVSTYPWKGVAIICAQILGSPLALFMLIAGAIIFVVSDKIASKS